MKSKTLLLNSGWVQHEESDKGKRHHKALGPWWTEEVPNNVGALLPRCLCYCVSCNLMFSLTDILFTHMHTLTNKRIFLSLSFGFGSQIAGSRCCLQGFRLWLWLWLWLQLHHNPWYCGILQTNVVDVGM